MNTTVTAQPYSSLPHGMPWRYRTWPAAPHVATVVPGDKGTKLAITPQPLREPIREPMQNVLAMIRRAKKVAVAAKTPSRMTQGRTAGFHREFHHMGALHAVGRRIYSMLALRSRPRLWLCQEKKKGKSSTRAPFFGERKDANLRHQSRSNCAYY
jgi:hypothetical protein